MKQPASRPILESLIQWADVVVENFSPGTMAKLGLDYTQLVQLNPRLIMASGSVFGQSGPLAGEWGVDGTGAALSGRTFLTGWQDRNPVIPGAVPYGDVIVPYVMAAAIAAALQQRNASGQGCHLDAAMYEICAQQMRTALTAAARGERPMRSGNSDPQVFHQGVYAAAGDDRWVALTLQRETDWQQLATALQLRAQNEVERDEALREWLRPQSDVDAVERLQAFGIAAGVVQDISDLMERDPQLRARGALVSLPHAVLGAFDHVRTPVSFSRSVVTPFQAPAMGEHTHAILSSLCGLSASRIAELESMGALR